MHFCDDLLHMMGADANNTQLTASIVSVGCSGASNASGLFTFVTSAVTLAVSDDLATAPPDSYFVKGSTGGFYPATAAFRSIRHDDNTALKAVYWDLSGPAKGMMTVFGMIKLGPPNQGVSSGLWDLIRITSVNGSFVVCQLDSGQGIPTGGYALNMETAPGGSTTHSSYITVTPGGTYWVCMKADYTRKPSTTPTAWLNVYTLDGTLVGSVTGNALGGADTSPDTIGDIRIGQDEAKTANTFTYFKGIAIDFSASFPVPPVGPAFQFPNTRTRPAAFKPGLAR